VGSVVIVVGNCLEEDYYLIYSSVHFGPQFDVGIVMSFHMEVEQDVPNSDGFDADDHDVHAFVLVDLAKVVDFDHLAVVVLVLAIVVGD